jgi:hypothetical protein
LIVLKVMMCFLLGEREGCLGRFGLNDNISLFHICQYHDAMLRRGSIRLQYLGRQKTENDIM